MGDDDLRMLVALSPQEVGGWLRRHQPENDAERHLWWEVLLTRLLQGLYLSDAKSDRTAFARLARLTTDEAVEQGVVAEREGAIRIANIAAFCIAHEIEAPFDVDSVVARCLELIEVELDAAAEQAQNWRALSIEQIRALRNAKNLIAPCVQIADQVADRDLADQLSGWRRLQNALP